MLTYANELSDFFSELDHYRPPDHESADWEYVLMDRGYKLLQGLRPEFEVLRSQLFNRENPLSFDETISQLLTEERRLHEMKGRIDSTAYVPTPKFSTPQQDTSKDNVKQGTVRPKENLWCSY